MTLADLLLAYVLAMLTGLVVLLRPRREPLPEGASVGFLVLVALVFVGALAVLALVRG